MNISNEPSMGCLIELYSQTYTFSNNNMHNKFLHKEQKCDIINHYSAVIKTVKIA